MLQIKNIRKSYTTGTFTQRALDGVSITLRNNEFVAILGPSGSGKTTLLNIIGGLDHYDEGDLVIDGVSTKKYKDRDWDAYRNNRIGFVFQSYNLIPHQTILANVELALTLSGVSPDERKRRATEALQRVGLGDHIGKKPSQLSGGQMQRVAIARALINDPEILLADEPTGALDSKTSVQIMDLLTEIASDRLVVMVTHNPELAEQYATRIVNLADGVIRSDTDPYNPTEEELAHVSAKKPRYTSMGLLTALSLSFNNLMTKKGRTLMTAIAGSIGIVGIAAILALANGVNQYIADVEEETLSEYPLSITESSFDISSMMGSAAPADIDDDPDNAAQDADSSSVGGEGEVGIAKMVTNMFDSVGNNDLKSLKAYLESGESGIEEYVNAIEYSYSVVPQLFNSDTEDGIHQVNPDKSFSALGLGSGNSTNLVSMTMSTNVFYEMPSDSSLYENSYDLLAGHWPENYNEVILVTTGTGRISDFMLYTLGLRDASELSDMVKQFIDEEPVSTPSDIEPVSYDTILNTTFKLVNAADYYEYDSSYDVWVDKSGDEDYMRELVDNSEDIHIVGIVKRSEDARMAMLQTGICYPSSLTEHVVQRAAESQIVKDQIDNPEVDVITNTRFDSEDEESGFDMSSLFSIDTGALSNAFQVDQSKLTVDMSALEHIDLSSAMEDIQLPDFDPSQSGDLGDMVSVDSSSLYSAIRTVAINYAAYCAANGITGDDVSAGFDAWLAANPDQAAIIQQAIAGSIVVNPDASASQQAAIEAYLQTAMASVSAQISAALQQQMAAALTQIMEQLGQNMASAMSIDTNAFANAFQINMDAEDLSAIMSSMMSSEERSYTNNLKNFGYVDLDAPSTINIYPISFESKESVIQILDAYNQAQEDAGEEDKVIQYTDLVGALMTSVTDIIDMISMVLIAFVAISLVVSSIMIGVITYISVLERIKEIGILRAIGASKKDISHVFNAETIIEGLVAGVLGIAVTAIGCFIANIILNANDLPQVAQLPADAAVILILISVALTFIAGVIPASSASKKDPVEALRSE